jgi:hypothetical protein
MVFAAISGSGVSDLRFVDPGVKINQHYYTDNILCDTVLPFVQQTFANGPYIFTQDGAPSHTSKRAQDFCQQNFHDFLHKKEWPATLPDLNPCDYFLWGYLEQKVNCKSYDSIKQLKAALVMAWHKLDQNMVKAACVQEFKKRLALVIKQKGGPFEHLL